MGVIAKYKFNQEIYADFIPEFNSEFTDYTITDEIDTDGYTIRTIESDSLPTIMRFGQVWVDEETDNANTNRCNSLLHIFDYDASSLTSMNSTFRNCKKLVKFKSSTDNPNVTSLMSCFESCSSLVEIDISNWTLKNTTSLQQTFQSCSSLTSLVSSFNTGNVTNMYGMFYNCSSLTSLDVSNFNTQNVTTMQQMFQGCSSLTFLDVSNFNTENVTNMSGMFQNCSSLTSLDVSNFNTEKVTSMQSMFQNCSKLTSLDINNFNTSKVNSMSGMFQNCSSLISLDVSNFNTEKVIYMNGMFQNCPLLTSIDISNFNTEKTIKMPFMFQNCSSLTSLDISNFNTENVDDMGNIFNGCSSLTFLDVSNFDTSNVTNTSGMFRHCSNLTSIDVSNFDTRKVTDMSFMFQGCSSLTSLDVSNFDTSNVTNMDNMFIKCSSLTSLDVSNFNTEKVTNMYAIFQYCSSLTSLDISNFNIEKVTNMENMFNDCKLLTNIGTIYCNSSTINKISSLITTNTTIWYMDSKLEDLTKKENITYKEYKMNILETNEEVELRSVGSNQDELNLLTGELTQYINKRLFDGSEEWGENGTHDDGYVRYRCDSFTDAQNSSDDVICSTLNFTHINTSDNGVTGAYLDIHIVQTTSTGKIQVVTTKTLNDFKSYLQSNPITVYYKLATPIIKTINLKNKPSINWQGDDIYLHLENNTLYPQLDCEIESINYYEIPKLKANTLYTLRYVGEPTQCIFGGLTYETENNMILTSGSSDNLLYFDKEVRKVVLIEGDVRDRNFDYFEGIESLGAVEIVTHKTNMPIFAKGGRK